MVRIFPLLLLPMIFFLNSCALNTSLPTNPVDNRTIPHPARTGDDKKRRADVKIMNDPQTLYEERQYDKALMAMIESDPGLLEDLSARKLLWRINDRLVTAQWYLQKGIAELLDGHKDKALHHIDEALELYPDHKPSRLLKQNLDSINLKENKKMPKLLVPRPKKISKNPTKENLRLADYYLMSGNIYFEKDQLTLAKTSWLQGLDIVPSHKPIKEKLVKLLTNEGLQLFGQGDIKASIAKWEEALKINPDDPEAKRYLDKARKAEEKVRSID